MGNSQNEKIKIELYLVRRKMKLTASKISKLLSVKEFDDLPFQDERKVLDLAIQKCEKRILEIQKKVPRLKGVCSPFFRDFKKMRDAMNNIQYRPDITNIEILDKLYPPPQLDEIPSEEFNLFGDSDDEEEKIPEINIKKDNLEKKEKEQVK